MPTPTAASDAYGPPNLRRKTTPARKTTADATAPQRTRASGPIQPLFTARMKKKTTPSSITTPPAQASAFAPRSSAKSISRRGRGGLGGLGGRLGAAGADGNGSRATVG